MERSRNEHDKTREADIRMLNRVLANPSKSVDAKQRAYKAREEIKKQVKDPRLNWMRGKMVEASNSGDSRKAREWESEIKDHRKEKWEDWG